MRENAVICGISTKKLPRMVGFLFFFEGGGDRQNILLNLLLSLMHVRL